jgi:hypothetical protein
MTLKFLMEIIRLVLIKMNINLATVKNPSVLNCTVSASPRIYFAETVAIVKIVIII